MYAVCYVDIEHVMRINKRRKKGDCFEAMNIFNQLAGISIAYFLGM